MNRIVKSKASVSLNERDLALVNMVCREMLNREIAERMGVGLRYVEKIRKRVYDKTGTASSVGILKWAVRNGIYRIKMPTG